MAEISLGIVLKDPDAAAAEDDWLELSQEDWDDASGSEFEEWLNTSGYAASDPASMIALFDTFRSQCEDDGSFTTKIFVSTSRPDLEYALTVDNGTLSDGLITSETVAKTFVISSPATSLDDFDWDVESLHSYEWQTVYEIADDGTFSPVSVGPVVTIQGGKPVWDKNVIGSLRLRFTADVSYYNLTVYPLSDTDDAEDSYQCTVMALWGNGNVETLEIDAPDTVGTCKGGASFSIGPGDDDEGDGDEGDDQATCWKRTIKVDACTQEVLSDTLTPMECPES